MFALIFVCLIFAALTAVSCFRLSRMASAAPSGLRQVRTVVVDAGHGGEDGGAASASGTLEKDLNLAIAKNLQTLLSASGFQVVMTRESDVSLADPLDTIRERKTSDIHNRLKLIQQQGDCIFLSIHQNHFSQAKYHGTQVFYSKNTAESKTLAEAIRVRVVSQLQNDNDRETKAATNAIYLLWHAEVPAVLVECGFLSNPEEAAKLEREEYQQKLALAISCGIADFCRPPAE